MDAGGESAEGAAQENLGGEMQVEIGQVNDGGHGFDGAGDESLGGGRDSEVEIVRRRRCLQEEGDSDEDDEIEGCRACLLQLYCQVVGS
ncbi:hypothetical protein KC19_VG294900 [Ceratodon purpureus]|uniref:Uncharacterized protein n=1 Tax=Ceratodon purpureus TaxID=3225 RepID=A0A8T0HV11_CERPU|nr:hypothetical protein KC19_VG294900 [Ceratodon purpureus]